MSKLTLIPVLLAVFGCLMTGCARVESAPTSTSEQIMARGKYIVENVGMCADCHTPMGPQGPDRARWLQGAEIMFVATVPVPDWAAAAPAIAGLPSLTDSEAVIVLTTGALPGGATLRPPMPAYRLNQEDATAVVAYLRSLAPRP